MTGIRPSRRSRVRSFSRAAWLTAAALSLALSTTVPAEAAGPFKPTLVAGEGRNEGGQFTAGREGAEFQLPSLARLKLAPGTSIRIFPVPQSLQLAPGAKTPTWSFALASGRVDVDVPAKPKSAVMASIGKLSAIMTRGSAVVMANESGAVVVNTDADVRTLVEDRWATLTPGTLGRHGSDHPAIVAEKTLAAPATEPGQRIWFSASAPATLSGVRWKAVERATGYDVRIRKADGSRSEQQRVTGLTLPALGFSPAEPGEYELTLRSVDRQGIEGAWSAPIPLRVLGVQLPPGGYLEGERIMVGSNQEVRFSHTEGLEMTYKGAGRFVPATNAVSLYRGETTIVSFRLPGSLDATTARIEPRGIFADVHIGPKRAVWPNDPVEVKVELKTTSGSPPPAWIEPKAEVFVGIEPLDVAFTREGNVLRATVPPTAQPGPWVLRVAVSDQYGASLGRDFLEIAEAPKPKAKPAAKEPGKLAPPTPPKKGSQPVAER